MGSKIDHRFRPIVERANRCAGGTKEDALISFEVINGSEQDQLDVYLDRDGLVDLLAQLGFLTDGKTDHAHLMSESWGGSHLSEEPVRRDASAIKHVKISLL